MFLHGYIPADATQTIICPSIKDKNGDLCDISNYDHIVFSKILEHVLLNRLQEHLKAAVNQFGFKRGHSTLMPTLLLKELLKFCIDHGSTMFVCFLDANKAFDRVDYTTLFRKLINHEMPTYLASTSTLELV